MGCFFCLFALVRTNIVEMLAMGIPALSPSAGQTSVDTMGSEGVSQYNLNGTTQKPNGWPRLYQMDDEPRWLHNDMKSMAYLYTYWLFEKMTEEGLLDE